MTLLVEPDASRVQLFESALAGAVAVVGTLAEAEDALAQAPHEFAVLVGPSVSNQDAFEFSERWRVRRASLSVLLVRPRVDRLLLTEALRAGVREVLESRDLAEVSNAVGRAHDLHVQMTDPGEGRCEGLGAEGRLVTVFSTKGGVGKTTVAVNFAAACAQQGKRVCVVDADITSGDVALMLQLFPSRSLGDLGDLRGVIQPTGVQTLLIEHSPGMTVLAAPMGLADVEEIRPDHFGLVLDVLLGQFDIVVVDTAPAFDDFALQAIDRSDSILLVGNPDMLSLKNVKVALSTLNLLNVADQDIHIVLNREDAKVGLSPKEFNDTLGMSTAATIPNSRDVPIALNKGQSLVLSQPRHEVSRAIAGLALKQLGDMGLVMARAAAAPQPTHDKTPSKAAGRRWFRRRAVEPAAALAIEVATVDGKHKAT